MKRKIENPYDTLGVKKDATKEQIKKAFYSRSKKAHPDKGGKAEEQQNINEAYAILANPIKRDQYDKTGTVEDFENKGMEIAIKIVQEIIAKDPDDIRRFINDFILNNKQAIKQKQLDLEKGKEKLKKFLSRLKKKPNGDFITPMVINQINGLDLAIQEGNLFFKSWQDADKILEAYSFEKNEQSGFVTIRLFSGGTGTMGI